MYDTYQVDATEDKSQAGDAQGAPTGWNLAIRVRTPSTTTPGRMIEFLADKAVVLTGIALESGTPLQIEFKGAELDGQVSYCVQAEDGYESHIHIVAKEEGGLRLTPRFKVESPALLWRGFSEEPVQCMVVDVSCEGLGIQAPLELAKGESVAVDWESQMSFGAVRHCEQDPQGGFHCGIQVCHVTVRRPEEDEKRLPKRIRKVWSSMGLEDED